MKKIETTEAPQAIGPYSQAVQAGGFLFLSGQLPLDPTTGKINGSTIEEQTIQIFYNIEAILKAASLTFKHVVRMEVFLADLSHFAAMNTIYATYFTGPTKPARHTIQAAKLPLNALIEITCTALINPS